RVCGAVLACLHHDRGQFRANCRMGLLPSFIQIAATADWLTGVPLFGERAALFWESVAAGSVDALVAKAAPYAGGAATWFVAALGGLGIVFVQFLLTVVIAAIMYVSGEDAAAATQRFGYRLAVERGRE